LLCASRLEFVGNHSDAQRLIWRRYSRTPCFVHLRRPQGCLKRIAPFHTWWSSRWSALSQRWFAWLVCEFSDTPHFNSVDVVPQMSILFTAMYIATKETLAPFRTKLKFLGIKLVLIINVLQGFVLSALVRGSRHSQL
jgi:hypothetical protein